MDMKTESLGTLTQVAFDKTCSYFKSIGNRVSLEFDSAVTFVIAAVIQHGDVTHANKLLVLLQIAKLEPMYRRTVVKHDLIPFDYDKGTCQHSGKINGPRRAALQMLNTDGVPQWEVLCAAVLKGELKENKKTAEFVGQNRMNSFFKAARKSGATNADITAWYQTAKRANPEDSTFATADDQVAIEENKVRLAGEVAKVEAEAAAVAA